MGMPQDGRVSQAEFHRDQCSGRHCSLWLHMNDIDDGITCSLLKFADDTKLLRKVGTQDDCEELQKNLYTMYKWSEDWHMMFNIDKCKCLHIGHGNNRTSYKLGGTAVPKYCYPCYPGKRYWRYYHRKPESQ